MNVVRRLLPRAVRHGISAQVARVQALRLERHLATLARGSDTIVAGPWLGEVGFELLYWVPFLAWFAARFEVPPERLMVVSRGGTASWYRPFAEGYREIFDNLSPDEFRRRHDERMTINGEQKQTQVLAFERDLLRGLTAGVRQPAMLHPSTMYRLFNPFWWGHLDERWVHARARYHALQADAAAALPLPQRPYVAVKFYFNECFPPTEQNRSFVRERLAQLAQNGPVVSLTTGLRLDDHGGVEDETIGVQSLPSDLDPRTNLAVQTAVVAGASSFVGTYGGFSYLAPFCGVRSLAYYSNPSGFSPRHLQMARSAFDALGVGDRFDVRAVDR